MGKGAAVGCDAEDVEDARCSVGDEGEEKNAGDAYRLGTVINDTLSVVHLLLGRIKSVAPRLAQGEVFVGLSSATYILVTMSMGEENAARDLLCQ